MSLAYRIVGSRAFVRRMQPGAGLVEDEDDAAQFGAELRGEPGPLQLTPDSVAALRDNWRWARPSRSRIPSLRPRSCGGARRSGRGSRQGGPEAL